MLDLFFVTYGP